MSATPPTTDSAAYLKPTEYELDEARYDQPALATDVPRREYVICTTPRCGSWLLCRQLFNAGLGVPSEYFNLRHIVALASRWNIDPRDTRAYLDALKARRSTSNGAWGTKLMWTQFAERRSALKIELMGRALALYLVRDDVTAQAASLLVSWTTGLWDIHPIPTTPPRDDLRFDMAELASLERVMASENAQWRDLFRSRRIEPMVISYESLVADQAGTVSRIAQALGYAESEYRVPPAEPRESATPADVDARRRALIERARLQRRI
ncbi:MAG TPA: Stf0 family sulfotransferase [Casimicrobiaceae bacterium]|jgi:LPS sulfotransferase NodH